MYIYVCMYIYIYIQKNVDIYISPHIAGSCSTWCPPGYSGPFLESCFKLGGVGLFLPRCRTLHFSLLKFMGFLSSSFLQPVEVPLDGSATVGHTSHSSHFSVIRRLAEGTHPDH